MADIPFRVTDPERIPAKRYYDAGFAALENEKLWPHVWQMACRLEQVENVGDWVEYSNLGKSVIVVRTKDGVKAFHNACRHRGVPLASEGGHGNCKTQGFICPFHGWRWNAEGQNTFVYGKHMFSEAQLDQADLALKPCRLETALGCAFINFDDAAPTLRDTMGPILDRMEAHGASKLRAEWWYATVLPANWKLAMEAFMEGYHVMRTHPQLQQAAPMLYNSMYGMDTGGIGVPINPNLDIKGNIAAQIKHLGLLSEGMAGMVHAKEVAIASQITDIQVDDPQMAIMHWFGAVNHQITEQLRAAGEDVPDLNAVAVSHPVNAVEFFFPHYFLLPMFSSMSAYRIRPNGPESCIFELWSLTHVAEGQAHETPMEPTVLPFDSDKFPPIPRQDYSNIPIQQKGLHAEGFDFMRLGKDIEGMISNYNRIIDGHLGGADPAKLAAATNTLAGNFDGKIFEYDF
ncbi:aromatic ring-hydroxylating dioxygenase subunit alpha [Sphingomonas sp. SUN039]|uniref:aromatic ring-hydroxylating oxygenase subunit alpha n=1 Tax=Sphingomonas sp. SUN039 TaxID=2937787 RepID=UPI002164261A|nr:aromatic ring-hydroxylating dioxygenase subunit alpha [Sphingomonas sp. SUN039]UVO54265.1 aromatic ring-hydroxylating dioxygenase subunit alpha [Sphingomonas sp. SUN039]